MISAVDSCPEVAVYAGKRLAALLDSGAAVSLIHLQAYKLMPETLKTAITLPGELETLTQPMVHPCILSDMQQSLST